MGFFYKLTWPLKPDVVSVAATGNFDNWTLSDPGQLSKNAESGQFETVLRVDEKQKLVFKFVVNGSTWKTNGSYKVETDEHGNQNNYVDADELLKEIEGNDEKDHKKFPVSQAHEAWPIRAASNDPEAIGPNTIRELAGENILSNEVDDEDAKVAFDDCLSSEDSEGIESSFHETLPAALESRLSEYGDAVSHSSTHSVKGVGSPTNETNGDGCNGSDANDFQVFSVHEEEEEHLLRTESSFTEFSFITTNSHNIFENLSEVPSPEAQMYAVGMFGSPYDYSALTACDRNTGTLKYNPMENDRHSFTSSSSDCRSDEDEVDSIGKLISSEDPGSAGSQPGVFAKIRGLFRF